MNHRQRTELRVTDAQNRLSSRRLGRLIVAAVATASAVFGVGSAQHAAATIDARAPATWITDPSASPDGPVVLHFRRDFDLGSAPAHLMVHVSADNRFILYVNGVRVGAGPARGDPAHWRYERFDLCPYLHAGHNHVAAAVWNWGTNAPMAQMSVRTGFFVQAESSSGSMLNSAPDWRVRIDSGHSAVLPFGRMMRMGWYYAAGPGETIDASRQDWSWNDDVPDSGWAPAVDSLPLGASAPWRLMADPLPPMRFVPAEAGSVVRSDLSGAGLGADSD